MRNLLIYYGWLNSFNSAENARNNEKVAQELALYDLLVFGRDLHKSTHGDYANTRIIIPRIKALNPDCQIYGYVSLFMTEPLFETDAKGWLDNVHFGTHIDGIFMDEAGYDFGTVTTNGREAFNKKVDFVHSKGGHCFINAWNVDHVLGTVNDPNFPNTTWNPDRRGSNLNPDDWYLLESFSYGDFGPGGGLQHEPGAQWKTRGDRAGVYRTKVQLASSCQIADTDPAGQTVFNFIFTAARMFSLDAAGSSDKGYGPMTARARLWIRPEDHYKVAKEGTIQIANDALKYMRYFAGARLTCNFTVGSESSEIKIL